MKKFHVIVREVIKYEINGGTGGHCNPGCTKEQLFDEVSLEMLISVWWNHKPLYGGTTYLYLDR